MYTNKITQMFGTESITELPNFEDWTGLKNNPFISSFYIDREGILRGDSRQSSKIHRFFAKISIFLPKKTFLLSFVLPAAVEEAEVPF